MINKSTIEVLILVLIMSMFSACSAKAQKVEISSKTQVLLKLLTKWGDGNQIYNLYNFRDMELHGSFEKCDRIEGWFDKDFNEKGYDFLEFGYTRAGDPYALWIYPQLQGEAPVVLLDGDGEVELLAPSLGDFLCLLTDEQAIFSEIEDDKISWYTIYNYKYNEIVDKYDNFKSAEEVKTKFKEEMRLLRSEVAKIYDCRSASNIIKDFDRHPNFKKWFEKTVIY
jgi:hypothetical protein